MVLPDVNVLVYAQRNEAPRHSEYRDWLAALLSGDASFGVADLVLSGVLRVLTHPRIFASPTELSVALEFVRAVTHSPACVRLNPGPRHFGIFTDLCRRVDAKGNAIPDAYLAALAIETGSDWVTADRGFARFPGLRWHHPLDRSP